MQTLRVAPPNSLILIGDPGSDEIPESMDGQVVASTTTCLAVGCHAEQDGETFITIGEDASPREDYILAYKSVLETPMRALSLFTVYGDVLARLRTVTAKTALSIW